MSIEPPPKAVCILSSHGADLRNSLDLGRKTVGHHEATTNCTPPGRRTMWWAALCVHQLRAFRASTQSYTGNERHVRSSGPARKESSPNNVSDPSPRTNIIANLDFRISRCAQDFLDLQMSYGPIHAWRAAYRCRMVPSLGMKLSGRYNL